MEDQVTQNLCGQPPALLQLGSPAEVRPLRGGVGVARPLPSGSGLKQDLHPQGLIPGVCACVLSH